ncbi:3635_t:CDS:2 [Funneliformis caledonium]|uniref:3635_t:CDS:1 n=1 Tax=Funneliformis caledonium TaxID=1117310 RepID=A0A9N8VK27_9GLOM|nr:3635_t:CDS:2 [Funneliformis caledonium]
MIGKELKDMLELLHPFYQVELILSDESSPSYGYLRLIYQDHFAHLYHHIMTKGIKTKLVDYWTYISQTSTFPALLDLSTILETFNEEDRKNFFECWLKNKNEDNVLTNELTTYPQIPNRDPLLWWKVNSSASQYIALMAADYHALQVASIPCERVYSIAKYTINLTKFDFLNKQ